MKKFFYYLMIHNKDSSCSYDKWTRIWHDIVEASDKKSARKLIENDLGAVVAEKISYKTKELPDYRIFITELTSSWEDHWLGEKTCEICSTKYTHLQVKQMGAHCTDKYCSLDCQRLTRRESDFGDYSDRYSNHRPCIYKITNKISGMVYIG